MSEHLRIAILGAPGTGKTTLAAALRPSFSAIVLEAAPADDNEAQRYRQRFDLTLLTGLDQLPNTADHALCGSVDQTLRDALNRHALPYALVYGQRQARCDNAMLAIQFHMRNTEGLPQPASRWRWACEKCSDPDCEHQLLSGLLRDS